MHGKARGAAGRVLEEQDIAGVDFVHVHDELVGLNGAGCVAFVCIEDGSDGPGQQVAVVVAANNHLVVLAAASKKRAVWLRGLGTHSLDGAWWTHSNLLDQ